MGICGYLLIAIGHYIKNSRLIQKEKSRLTMITPYINPFFLPLIVLGRSFTTLQLEDICKEL